MVYAISNREGRKGMAFKFDKTQALKPIKVSWRIRPTTLREIEKIAKEEGVEAGDVAQQALDHVLANRRAKRPATAAASEE